MNKFKMGKYIGVYLPSHPRATKEGVIYEHMLVAEEKIGRYLKDGEVVHHIDENKYNNSSENLIVFKTNSDHISFHKGNKNIKLDGDVYIATNKKEEYIICPICNKNKMYNSANMCKLCFNKNRKELLNGIEIDIEELKKDVYYNSFLSICKKYNSTDNGIRKWMKRHNLIHKKEIIKLIPFEEWMCQNFSEETKSKITEYNNIKKATKEDILGYYNEHKNKRKVCFHFKIDITTLNKII